MSDTDRDPDLMYFVIHENGRRVELAINAAREVVARRDVGSTPPPPDPSPSERGFDT